MNKYLSAALAVLLLGSSSSSLRAESVYANGFFNSSLGWADLDVWEPYFYTNYYPVGYGAWSPDNTQLLVSDLGDWGLDGVNVKLGKAQEGAYFHVWAYAEPGRTMSALSFGSVNGKPGQYLAAISGRREGDYGQFTAWVDFSPLCFAPYRYQFYYQGSLANEVTTWDRELRIYSYGAPRVNPAGRQPDGTVAAIIDFQPWSSASVSVGTGEFYADKIVITPTGHTNRVDYLSSVQIRGGGGLTDFQIPQVQPVVFHRPHRAIGGGARLEVTPDHITLTRGGTSLDPRQTLWIEAPRSGSFEALLQPAVLSHDTAVSVEGIGLGNWGLGTFIGAARLHRLGEITEFQGNLTICTNMQAAVFREGLFVGATPFATNLNSLSFTGDVQVVSAGALAQTTNVRAGLFLRLDRVVSFTGTNGEAFDGDEVRLQAGITASLVSVDSLAVGVSNLAALTIINEIATPVFTPELHITTTTNQLVLSWLDPNRQYYVQCSANSPMGYWNQIWQMPMYMPMNFMASLTLDRVDNEDRFYRLVAGPTWDVPMGGNGRD